MSRSLRDVGLGSGSQGERTRTKLEASAGGFAIFLLCRFAETLHCKKGLQTAGQLSGVKLLMLLLVRKNHLKRLMKNVHLGKASWQWDRIAIVSLRHGAFGRSPWQNTDC